MMESSLQNQKWEEFEKLAEGMRSLSHTMSHTGPTSRIQQYWWKDWTMSHYVDNVTWYLELKDLNNNQKATEVDKGQNVLIIYL